MHAASLSASSDSMSMMDVSAQSSLVPRPDQKKFSDPYRTVVETFTPFIRECDFRFVVQCA